MTAIFKWTSKPKRPPAIGDTRVVRKFLLAPKQLGGECRWLGRERITQEYKIYADWTLAGGFYFTEGWIDVEWAE